MSVKENAVKEEAGLDVTADLIIAVQDREKHNLPVYAYKVCKIFILCTAVGGGFEENIETVESRYFGLGELPELATEKNNAEQIKMCFDAYHAENWKTLFDETPVSMACSDTTQPGIECYPPGSIDLRRAITRHIVIKSPREAVCLLLPAG